MTDTYLKRNINVISKDKQKDISEIRKQENFVSFSERPKTSHVHIDTLLMSQGVKDCTTWKGIPLYKTVFDFTLYSMMIWDIKPATILEIGSGPSGGSAIWMADLCKMYGLVNTKIISVDINPPTTSYEGVTFVKGDSEKIETLENAFSTPLAFDIENYFFVGRRSFPSHPWLIIEDAHVNVNAIIAYFDLHMNEKDYMIIEDTRGRVQTKLKIPNTLFVDTYYCDYFGRNATCSMNSILYKK